MRKYKALAAASGIVIAMVAVNEANAGAAVSAQNASTGAGDNTTTSLGEVIVTARRVNENQQRVPVAVTALSAETLQKNNVKAVTDIQFSVPNLQIKPSNLYPGQPEFIIRGQRQQLYTDENVVTYVNGVPQGTRGLTLYDLASVQALKGPQGTLFGKSSLGGAMVFTTARPTYDLGGSLEVEFGNYNRKAATGVINVPLIADKAALRIAGNIERRDGVFKNSTPGQEDPGNRHNESVRGTLLLEPSNRFENITTVDYLHRNEAPSPSVIEAAPTQAPGFAALVSTLTRQGVIQQSALAGATPVLSNGLLVRQGSPFYFATQTGLRKTSPGGGIAALNTLASYLETYGVANTTTLKLNDTMSVRNIFGYRHEDAIDQQDPSAIGGFQINISPFLTALGVPGLPAVFPATVINNSTNYTNKRKTFTDELQYIVDLPNLKFIAGGYYAHQTESSTVNSFFTIGPVSLYPQPTHYREGAVTTTSKALFAQGTYDFSSLGAEGLRVTFGARYNADTKSLLNHDFYSSRTDFNQTFNPATDRCAEVNRVGLASVAVNNGAQCSLSGKHSWHALTYTASVEYQISPRSMVYAATRRGYKTGGVTPTSSVNPDFNFFAPEKLTDYELGLKHEGEIGTAPYRLNVAGFLGKYSNIQTQDIIAFCIDPTCPGAAPPNYTDLLIFNVGKATIKGVEVEGTIKPIPDLQLDIGYSYQIGRYGDGSVIPQPLHAGPVGINNPINFGSGINVSGLEFPGVPRTTLSVAGTFNMRFIPESFAKAALSMNYAHRSSTRGLTSAGVFGAPSYGVLGGRLTFNDVFGSRFAMALWAQNLTNAAYRLGCSDNLNSIGYATCKWGDPRTYGVTGSVKF